MGFGGLSLAFAPVFGFYARTFNKACGLWPLLEYGAET